MVDVVFVNAVVSAPKRFDLFSFLENVLAVIVCSVLRGLIYCIIVVSLMLKEVGVLLCGWVVW